MSLLPLGELNTENRLLRLPEVTLLTGLPTSTIYLKMKSNDFPKQMKIGSRSVAWLESEINEWIINNARRR
ncbi:AlpA family transcriptional regulator [Providencia vermicola]|nr:MULTISPECIES: AlpA family transcriptional regulator [Providencia]USR63508.1 AlpA family transcriptional regulator [Providencia stuartii]EMA4781115.1 AlpA family transcriptional regulator [Providencia rettgeri]MBQ0207972.1 AlpA family transcriptional regulator [Providencia rettgeri]MBQ0688046.1 AlpA family transcriptional regulator [Providencia rettgeri]MDR9614166.1 AlpA family transcriptional regulator [Providencia rettgeri]